MDARKPRDGRHRPKRVQQERRDLFQKKKNRPHALIGVLASKRAARETARMATQETAFTSSPKDSFIPATSHPAAPGLASVCSTMDDWMSCPTETSSDRHSIITLVLSGYTLVPQLPQYPSISSKSPGHSDSIRQGL